MEEKFTIQECKLLDILQKNTRRKWPTYKELAKITRMSVSTVRRRVIAWKELGVVRTHEARLDRQKVGLDVMAFVVVKLLKQDVEDIAAFRQKVEADPHIIECWSIFGSDQDYVLRIVFPTIEEYTKFTKDFFHEDRNLGRQGSFASMEKIKETHLLPLDHLMKS